MIWANLGGTPISGNPQIYPLVIKHGNQYLIYGRENHRSKWVIFQQATFDRRRIIIYQILAILQNLLHELII
jgi:hypothetical protein